MLREVYTERSACAQHDSAATHTDSWMNLLNSIIGPRWIFRSPDEKVTQHYCVLWLFPLYHRRFFIGVFLGGGVEDIRYVVDT